MISSAVKACLGSLQGQNANISIRIENMKTLRAQNSSSESKPLFRKLASEIEEPEISDTVPPYTER